MRFSFAACSVLFFAACSSSQSSGPTPVEVYSTGVPGEAAAISSHRMTASVLAVDTAARRLTLRGEDGHTETISVPPEVKRFNEISAGDVIDVEVQEGLLFEYQPPGSSFVPPTAVVAGARAGKDLPPGAAALVTVQSTVTITSINLKSRVVELQDPDGYKYEVKAGPKLAIERLTVGDRLVATYAASAAIVLDKK
jgi:hypothetical protein